MIDILKGLIPTSIKLFIHHISLKRKYDVVLEKGASAGKKTVFEGKNLLKQNAQVYSSFVGLGTYISGNCKLNKVHVGRFCSIGQNVNNSFGIHPTDWISTHPAFYSTQKQAGFTFTKKQLFEEHRFADVNRKYLVKIGNDVWIGNDVKIFDGVTIGDGAIIAAGAIVTKDVEPYSIVGGVPVKLIRYRFSEDEIAFLKDFRWWDRDLDWIEKHYIIFNDIDKLRLLDKNGNPTT